MFRESLADSLVAVSTLASMGEIEKTAPKAEETASPEVSNRSSYPMVSSSVTSSDISKEYSESPSGGSVSRIDLLRDISSLFSGAYVKDSTKDSKFSEREKLCELMDLFDNSFHHPKSDSAQDSFPSKIDGSSTLQDRTTAKPDHNHLLSQPEKKAIFHTNQTHISSMISHPRSETRQAFQRFEKEPTMMKPLPNIVESSVAHSASKNTNNDSSNSTFFSATQKSAVNASPYPIPKGPLRLSSRNFASKSSSNQAVARPVVDTTGTGASGGKSGPEWIIMHGRLKSLAQPEPSAGTESKGLSPAERIEIYFQKNSTNPFKHKEGENYLRSFTPNRRRWSHVFPAGF